MITPRDVARVARQEHIPVWLAQALAAKVTLEEGLRADRERPDRLSVVDASPIAPLLLEIAADGFAGTCTELLDRLELRAEPETRRSKAWPKTPQALSGRLHRLAPTLRANDVEVEWDRLPGGNRTRIVRLHKHDSRPSRPSRPSPRPPPNGTPGTPGTSRSATMTSGATSSTSIRPPASRRRST